MTILLLTSAALNATLLVLIVANRLRQRRPSNEIGGILLPSPEDERWQLLLDEVFVSDCRRDVRLGSVVVGSKRQWGGMLGDGYVYESVIWIDGQELDGGWGFQKSRYRDAILHAAQQRKALAAIEGA